MHWRGIESICCSMFRWKVTTLYRDSLSTFITSDNRCRLHPTINSTSRLSSNHQIVSRKPTERVEYHAAVLRVLHVRPSVRPFAVCPGLLTRKRKWRTKKTKISANILHGKSNQYANLLQKVDGHQTSKTQKIAAYSAYIYLPVADYAPGDSGADCKVGLTIVRQNSLVTPETLGNSTDGRMSCWHAASASFLVLECKVLELCIFRRWRLPQEATKRQTTQLSRLLRRLLDEVDRGDQQEDKQESSTDVGFSHSFTYLKSQIRVFNFTTVSLSA